MGDILYFGYFESASVDRKILHFPILSKKSYQATHPKGFLVDVIWLAVSIYKDASGTKNLTSKMLIFFFAVLNSLDPRNQGGTLLS